MHSNTVSMTISSTSVRAAFRMVTLTLVFLISGTAVSALANDFDNLVKRVESQYKVRQKKIPFLGLAGFAVRIVRPAGVKEFKLALFENHNFAEKPGDP